MKETAVLSETLATLCRCVRRHILYGSNLTVTVTRATSLTTDILLASQRLSQCFNSNLPQMAPLWMLMTVPHKQLFQKIWQQALKFWKQLTWIQRGEKTKIPRSQRSTTYKYEVFKPCSQFLSCTSEGVVTRSARDRKYSFTFPAVASGLRISVLYAILLPFSLSPLSFLPQLWTRFPKFTSRNLILPQAADTARLTPCSGRHFLLRHFRSSNFAPGLWKFLFPSKNSLL
jgi:hypothetical protein